MKTIDKIEAMIDQKTAEKKDYEKVLLDMQENLKQVIEKRPDNPLAAIEWIRHNGEQLEYYINKVEKTYEDIKMLNYLLR